MAALFEGLVSRPLQMLGLQGTPPDQLEVLDEMRRLLRDEGVDGDVVPESDLRRFLEARQFSPSAATEMYLAWRVWYSTPLPKLEGRMFKDVDFGERVMTPANILDFEIPGLSAFNAKHSCLSSLCGEDREGAPILWEKTGLSSSHFQGMLEDMSESDMITLHILQQEIMVKRLEQSSLKHGRCIDKFVVVSDLDQLTLSLDPGAMRLFLTLSALDQKNYPERLKKLYFVNTPFYWWPIWSVVWPFMSPGTVNKIQFLGTDFRPSLFEQVDEANIPTDFGGTMVTSWDGIAGIAGQSS